MTHSRKRVPIGGITAARSEKADKRFANRRLRRTERAAIYSDAEVMPVLREVSNIWNFDKDGKTWYGHVCPRPCWVCASPWPWRVGAK